MNQANEAILDSLRSLYSAHGVTCRELHHEPTPTSEDSARVRGEPLYDPANERLRA